MPYWHLKHSALVVYCCYTLLQNPVTLSNQHYLCFLIVFVGQEFRTGQSRDGVSPLQSLGPQLEDQKAGGWNPLKTAPSHIWWLMICQLRYIQLKFLAETSTHVSSPHGLSLFTIWWLDSKDETTRPDGVKILLTKPQSLIPSLNTGAHSWMLKAGPIHGCCHKALPGFKGREQIQIPSYLGSSSVGSH